MVRKYQDSDLAGIIDVWYQAASLAHPFLTSTFMEQEKKNIQEIYLPNSETWVVESNGKLVGFISMIGNEIGGLFVHPDCHGKGIGTTLVNFAAQIYPILEVEVFKQNQLGKPFYYKYGFHQLKEYIHEASGQVVLRMQYKKLDLPLSN